MLGPGGVLTAGGGSGSTEVTTRVLLTSSTSWILYRLLFSLEPATIMVWPASKPASAKVPSAGSQVILACVRTGGGEGSGSDPSAGGSGTGPITAEAKVIVPVILAIFRASRPSASPTRE